MLLTLKNTGRLKEAQVKIDGLTVICGDNNTGKSTIGKILYCIYDSFHNLDENIRKDKIQSLIRYLINSELNPKNVLQPRDVEKQAAYIIDNAGDGADIHNLVRGLFSDDKFLRGGFIDGISLICRTKPEDTANTFMTRRLEAEFGQKLGNVNHPRKRASVSLNIKDDSIDFYSVGSKHNLTLRKYFSLNKTLIYIDDPFMIDDLNNYDPSASNEYGHRGRMLGLLYRSRTSKKRTVTEEIITAGRLAQIIGELNSISDGELVFDGYKFSYRHSGLAEPLNLSAVSTGIKTFMILKELLINGVLEENGIVIVDEPEVHLHPSWQIKFAEIIVLLQKAYGLNIVLTTHSMDFLSAVDYFSQKHGITEVCNYYLTSLEERKSAGDFPCAVIREMNSDKEALYASVSAPFLSLYGQMNS